MFRQVQLVQRQLSVESELISTGCRWGLKERGLTREGLPIDASGEDRDSRTRASRQLSHLGHPEPALRQTAQRSPGRLWRNRPVRNAPIPVVRPRSRRCRKPSLIRVVSAGTTAGKLNNIELTPAALSGAARGAVSTTSRHRPALPPAYGHEAEAAKDRAAPLVAANARRALGGG